MTSAIVYIRDYKDNIIECRALLDTCATANFISENLVKRLHLSVLSQSTTINAINATSAISKGVVQITIQSIYDNFKKVLTCLTIPIITDLTPSEIFPRDTINIPSNIRLADPEFHLPRPVDLLIGSGASISLLSIGQINLTREGHDLFLQKTRLGWVVAGGTTTQTSLRKEICGLTNLETQLEKFWEVEDITGNTAISNQDNDCEIHFLKTVSRNDDGRYVIRLPFKGDRKQLGESRNMALRRLLTLEQRFHKNANLKDEYTRIIDEYLRLNYLSLVEGPEGDGYYMPHHAVIKDTSNTTKVRIVFDASAKTSTGVSLNDTLLVGPTIQNKLFSYLIRFRTYKYAVTADVEKMYLQILLHEDDRQYQRILWRRNGKIVTLQFNTLTFGVSSSPFLATRVIHKLADDESNTYPRAANILKNHLYVDDLLSGADSLDEVRAIRDEIINLLKCGGLTIRQWASNDERVVNDLATTAIHASFIHDENHSLRTLGMTWLARKDEIRYTTQSIKAITRPTKRHILSEITKIFDPLGLLGPIIFYAKKLMQDLWRCQLNWDESVPQDIYTSWMEYSQQLELLNQISFNRRIVLENIQDAQIHGFCDASSSGYGACIYVRSTGKDDRTIVRLLCARSRVAPLKKTITIPRLELCGASLLAQLYHEVIQILDIVPNKVIFWCDSMIVLHWLRTSPHLLNTFVANRVTEIQQLTDANSWRHIKSEDNPADAISRGQLPRTFLQNRTWFTGPNWLSKDKTRWPNEFIQTMEISEMRRNACLTTTNEDLEIFKKYSSYSKLIRIIAYCLRFRLNNKYVDALCTQELDEAEIRTLRILQAMQFSDEIKRLKNKESITQGTINNLSPFIDDNGLIRVGGRLQKSNLTCSAKHPILLPSRHIVTDQIIRDTHVKHYHAGIQTTLHILRQKYWLIDGRNQVRKIIRNCVRCTRFSAKVVEYKMGNLPSVRVRESLPFSNTGVDFCGPFYIKERKHRNRTRIKVYVCVFICMTVKAVHLEIVSDLTSEGFIAALRRFISRRGIPDNIYSDNGTNFVGANNQLKEMYACFNSDKHRDVVNKFAIEHRIIWHFIPPMAPHFGGLWESTVKIFKHHFKRVIGDLLFTFEELNTFVVEIEGILNSRPITSLSSDPNDLTALSPAHYLIGRPITALPEGDLSSVTANRLSTWQHISKVRQDFWTRWNLEYLNELQSRSKWIKDGKPLDIGTIVLLKEKNLPCSNWALGKVVQVHPGEDGTVRAATVKTTNGDEQQNTYVHYLSNNDNAM